MPPVAPRTDRRRRRPRAPEASPRPPEPAALPVRVFRLGERHSERVAGQVLRFEARPSRAAVAGWLLVAAMIGLVLALPAREGAPVITYRAVFVGVMLGALALAWRAFISTVPYRIELDQERCRVRRMGQREVVHRLPIEGILRHDVPLRDADGQPFSVRLSLLPTSGLQALWLRSVLAAAPIAHADRVVLEAIALSQIVERGRAEGYLGVAVSRGKTTRALAVFGDRESYTAWAASAPLHVLAGVLATDQSGKGASVGYPSPVLWGLKPTRLLRRARVYAEA